LHYVKNRLRDMHLDLTSRQLRQDFTIENTDIRQSVMSWSHLFYDI